MGRYLGQHFLSNPRLARKIVESAELPYRFPVFEIGPGRGALTKWLLEAGHPVLAVELDRRLVEYLQSRFGNHPNFYIIHADILKIDWLVTVSDYFDPPEVIIAGNLPYQISSPILDQLIRYRGIWPMAVLMFQREFADRLMATVGSKNYGALSVMAQSLWKIERLMSVSPGSFTPPPKIHSTVLKFTPRESPLLSETETGFSEFVHTGFHHPRKTLLNNLKFTGRPEIVTAARLWLEKMGLTSDLRPHYLSPEQWADLYKFVVHHTR